MKLAEAIEVFVRGFSVVKSRAHPYIGEKVNDLWILRDGPGRKDPRKIEVVASGNPDEVVRSIKKLDLGWHFLCNIRPPDGPISADRMGFKKLGYRAVSTEWLFIHELEKIPSFESNPPVRIVASQIEADAIRQVAKHKVKLLSGTRQFGVWNDERDYGWVTSIPVGDAAWVSSLYVHRDVRGRGYGRALMSALLQADREAGVKTSVLLASSSGARLYPHLGYEQIGVLQMFCPAERTR